MTGTALRGAAVVGGGSLARTICYSLATQTEQPIAEVTVAARSAQAAREIAAIANARAAVSSCPTRFTADVLDAAQPTAVARFLEHVRPGIVVNCASLQSPWESAQAASAWTRLLAEGGFGIGLPLHAVLARELASAIRRSGLPTAFVNACYPDAVNPLLAAEGLPVLCGVGNVATLAATLRAALRTRDGEQLRVMAHHLHLHRPADPADEVRAWLGKDPVPDVGELLAVHRSCSRAELNEVTGHAAAQFLARLSAGQDIRTDLPGPLGLPGGYPVRAQGRQITLDLPDGVTRSEAVSWQQRMAEQDGVVVSPAGEIRLGPQAASAVATHLPGLPEHYDIRTFRKLTRELLLLREKLRTTPA
ncbi:hypothetical protein [Streptomyces sp. NPDC053542]|uniref:hypothetical protein n=1 Tax=Streptomyces sp. NPDC053542 TaxID=3365710 RepID=UPI0037CEF0D2